MVILHVGRVYDGPTNGVCVVVPGHIASQARTESVALLNISQYTPTGVENVFFYHKPFSLGDLPAPFDKPDIVIFHQVYFPAYRDISEALRRAKIPYVIVPHSSLTKEAQSMKRAKKIVGNIIYSSFIRSAAAIQCLSAYEVEQTRAGRERFLGTNGIPMPQRKKESFSEGKLRFIYIGRLDAYHKGLDILLDAFKMISESEYADKCELDIYGPDYRGRYARLEGMIAERALGGIVKLSGPVFGEEKINKLLGADVFIQTSRLEGMPMGILESLSYGMPCLVTEGTTVGGFIEKYGAGWSAKTDAKSVFECIVRAVSERESLPLMVPAAQALIEDNFLWDKVTEANLASYRKYTDLGEN